MPTLHAQNIGIGYGSPPLYENLNLHLACGQLVALLGLNGRGKSTLLRSLAGLQPLAAGEVRLDDAPLHRLSPKARARKLSLVLTDPIEAVHLRAHELVSMGRQPYTNWWGSLSREDQQKTDEALHLVQAESLRDRRFGTLSDGEKQRILLARALAQETPFIFLDEPTAHLDTYHQRELFRLLRRLAQEQNRAILVATHTVRLAVSTADYLWILDEQAHLGLTEDLALSGTLSEVFFDGHPLGEGLTDPVLAQKEVSTFKKQICLQGGDARQRYFTTLALRKNGIQVTEAAKDTLRLEQGPSWHYHQHRLNTLAAVLSLLA